MSKSASYIQKYWFALGYHDSWFGAETENYPNQELITYYKELTNTDIEKEYNLGWKVGLKDASRYDED